MAERGQALKDRLARSVDEDTDAFNRVMEAMRMPKGTPEQQAERTRAIEAANKAPPRSAQRPAVPRGDQLADGRDSGNKPASDAGNNPHVGPARGRGAAVDQLSGSGRAFTGGTRERPPPRGCRAPDAPPCERRWT
jgi:hypothetical protein